MKKLFAEKLALSSIGVVILGIALLAGSSDEYRRNAAFAFDSYGGSCPVYEGGRCYQQSGIACYEVDCGVDEEITVVASATPIPTPTDLTEPMPDPAEVTPTQPGNPGGGPIDVNKMNRAQMLDFLQNVCSAANGGPGASDPEERARMVGDGIRSCQKALETRDECRWLLGASYFHPLTLLGRFGQPYHPLDPVNLLATFVANESFRDPGTGNYNPAVIEYAFTSERYDDPAIPIVLVDSYFGWSRPVVPCGADNYCSDADLRAEVDLVANIGGSPDCTNPVRTQEERGLIVCHEIGHRSQKGRHRNLAESADYNARIIESCYR